VSRAILHVVLALAVLAAPLAGEAGAGTTTSRIGYLSFYEPRSRDDVFRQALRDLGWLEGQNLVIGSRFAERDLSRLRLFAEELVRLNVLLIVTTTGRSAAVVKEVTSTVPIVMTSAGDAVRQGLVASLARPGGNVTGLTSITPEAAGKRLELLKDTVPRLSRVALVGCWDGPVGKRERQETQAAAAALNLHLVDLALVPGADFKGAVKRVVEQQAEALLVGDCPTGLPPARQLAQVGSPASAADSGSVRVAGTGRGPDGLRTRPGALHSGPAGEGHRGAVPPVPARDEE
jgi:putative ABC transport system substrate-binding protein